MDRDLNSNPDDPNEHPNGDLTARLGALVPDAVDPATRAAHLRRAATVATVEPVPSRRRFGVIAVGAAAVVGFIAGSAGLAAAGALPDPAQNVAHDVFGVVQVDVPQGKSNRGSCISEAAKIDDKDAKQAAKDACPKGGTDVEDDTDETDGGEPETDSPGKSGDAPGQGGDSPGKSGDAPGQGGDSPGKSGDAPGQGGDSPGQSGEAPGQAKHADDPCRGKPAWAGPMSKAEREALKSQQGRDACIDTDDADDIDEPAEPDDADEPADG